MSSKKVCWWILVPFFIYLVSLGTAEVIESREIIYALFKVPKFFWRPKNVVNTFERKNYAHIQIDVFIGSETADSRLANIMLEDCLRRNSLMVSSSSEIRRDSSSSRDTSSGVKIQNLILVYDAASNIDLEVLKTTFGNRWNPRARIIICVEKVDSETATKALEYFWAHDSLNVALTVQNQTSGVVENFIYNPFVPGKLPRGRGIVERFNSGGTMFPDKLTNLHNHIIPVSIFFYFPKAQLKNFTGLHEGADIEVLQALSKKLNFSTDLKFSPSYGISYTIRLPSGEEVGMIGDVLVNRSDIVFNTQYLESTNGRRVEFTYPMLQTGYCVLVPKAKIIPMIVRMVLPFPEDVWMAMIAVLGFLLISFTLMGEKNKLMQIVDLLLHQSFVNIPERTFNRIFCISCILWAYLMICFYQANFINEFMVPKYYKDLQTLDEVYNSKLALRVGDNMIKVLNNSEVPILKKISKSAADQVNFRMCAYEMLTFFNTSCAVDEYTGDKLSRSYYRNSTVLTIHMVKECISLHWDVYVAKDGFPFLEKFNQLIQSLLEGGLYKKWLVDSLKRDISKKSEPRTTVLTIKHCEGAFGLLLLGFCISAAVFILELATFTLSPKIAEVFHSLKEKTLSIE